MLSALECLDVSFWKGSLVGGLSECLSKCLRECLSEGGSRREGAGHVWIRGTKVETEEDPTA